MSHSTSPQAFHHRIRSDRAEEASSRSKRIVRNYIACRRCHTQKVKCSGETPCRNCKGSKTPVECVYPVRDRKVAVSERYVKQLEDEIQSLKRKSPWPEHAVRPAPALQPDLNHAQPEQCTITATTSTISEAANPSPPGQSTVSEEDTETFTDETNIQPTYVGEAACTTFGGKLRQFLLGEDNPPIPERPKYYKSQKMLRASCTDCQLPNRSDAQLLVRVVLRFIGPDYHLLRRKSFLARLDETYKLEVLNDPIWLCRLFTVFALGEIYTVRSTKPKGNSVPGISFFLKALEYFQDLYEEPTLEYIETLLLLSFYSTTLNRRNTAYTYLGLAMRLSMMLGLHRKIPANSPLPPSEREHRIRVWWTVYCLDRMMSSKVGHPVMIQDKDIDAQLPSRNDISDQDMGDFYDPAYLLAQISLARIVGNVLGNIYHIPQSDRADSFVKGVQTILASLRDFRNGLPPMLRLEPNSSPMYPNRSVASLHLHFNQCVILTTRPILFYVFRQRFTREAQDHPPFPHMIKVLSNACVETARTSNAILSQLWVDGCLAMYGFYDALSIFSSTLVLMLASAMEDPSGAHEGIDEDGIGLAWSLLRSMRDDGNVPASDYYEQLLQLKDALKEACARKTKTLEIQASSIRKVNGLHMLLEASSTENSLVASDAIAAKTGQQLTPSDSNINEQIGNAIASNDRFMSGFWSQPQTHNVWAPAAFESMFTTSANEQLLWDMNWESGGLI